MKKHAKPTPSLKPANLEQVKRLLNLPHSKADWTQWTETFLQLIPSSFFKPQPILIRTCVREQETTFHIRRNSRMIYLALSPDILERTQTFFLSPEGHYHYSRVKIERPIKDSTTQRTVDRTLEILPCPYPEQQVALEAQQVVASVLKETGYQNWSQLTNNEKRQLVALGYSPRDIIIALQQSPPEQLQLTLELLLKKELTTDEASEFEKLLHNLSSPLPLKCLGWVLQHPSWSHSSYLLAFSEKLIAHYPRELASYIEHPDPGLRLRLAQLHPKTVNLAKWYASETDDNIKLTILTMLRKYASLQNIVDSLIQAQNPAEAKSLCHIFLGWSSSEPFHSQELLDKFSSLKLSKPLKAALSQRLKEQGLLPWATKVWHSLWYRSW